MKSPLNRMVAGCLWIIPVLLPASEPESPGELITLSPFVVETGHYHSQFQESGLVGLGQETPFNLQGTLASELDWVLGVSLQRMGLHSVEPIIQGMGFDRIVTSLNGIYLPNASPTHTASPLSFMDSSGQYTLEVIRSLPSVSLGPVPTGSRILVESANPAVSSMSMRLSADIEQGRSASLAIRDKFKGNPFSVGLHHQENGDYDGGGNRVVDSDYRAWGLQMNGKLFHGRSHATTLAANYYRQELSRNAALPLDTKDTPSLALAVKHSIILEHGLVRLRAGYTRTEPYLTSEDRRIAEGAPVALVDATGETSSYTVGGDWNFSVDAFYEVKAGIDCTWQNRVMLRRRHLKSGAVLEDLIWPDIDVLQSGAFLELSSAGKDSTHWRFGARLDKVSSRANDPDQPVRGVPGALGNTIRENFIAFHGPGAESAERHEWTGAVNGILEVELNEHVSVHCGLGYTVAPAGPGEHYRSFVNALGGGVEIGNPTLEPERKTEVHAGVSYTGKRFHASAASYYMEINDFAGREVISSDPLIYSFRNKDVEFNGVHVAMEFDLYDLPQEDTASGGGKETGNMRISIPASLSLVHGQDARTGKGLPEIPPLEADVGLRLAGQVLPVHSNQEITLYCRHVAAKDNPQPGLNPIFHDTRSYTLVDLEMAMAWQSGWSLALRIENILDREAYAYLQPPVATGPIAPSSGNLSGGDRIPLRGRHVLLTLGFDF